MTDKIVVLSTCGSAEEASRIARGLVEARLAACVHILPGGRSVYRWQGQVEDAPEHQLFIKSTRPAFSRLRAELERMHSYAVPEIIALPVVDGAAGYLSWLGTEVRPEAGGGEPAPD